MSILFIAPLPPPVSGNSLAIQVFKEELNKTFDIDVVNFNKDSFKNNSASFRRIFDILGILKQVAVKRNKADLIYFSVSESIAGNLKDLVIYLICHKKLSKTLIHLHGGAGMKVLLGKENSTLFHLNKYFLKRLGGVIVLGQSHVSIFEGIVARDKIHIVHNFAQDYLFSSEEDIIEKFNRPKPLRILFLSNLIYGKGHHELLDAFLKLDVTYKEQVQIDFAGLFEDESQQAAFLKKMTGFPQLQYHGFVTGSQKEKLLKAAHVFCLPTYYPYEGQPISILEAYASGCAVVTTDHSGINDVFSDGENGFQVEKRSVGALQSMLELLLKEKSSLRQIGMHNRAVADQKFRTNTYNAALKNIVAQLVD